MRVHVLGSSSKGNGYIFETENESLIVECGLPLKSVKKALKFDISKVAGAIVTHEHKDHDRYISEYASAGIVVLSVFKEGVNFKKIEPNKGYKVGGFRIVPLSVNHDVPCVAYLIRHTEVGSIIFVTDTVTFGYVIPGVKHILIEANYSDEILEKNIENGLTPISMRSRLLNSHMEIKETKRVLQSQNLNEVENIILIHLSDGNSNEEHFLQEVKDIAPMSNVFVADKGQVFELNNLPY